MLNSVAVGRPHKVNNVFESGHSFVMMMSDPPPPKKKVSNLSTDGIVRKLEESCVTTLSVTASIDFDPLNSTGWPSLAYSLALLWFTLTEQFLFSMIQLVC